MWVIHTLDKTCKHSLCIYFHWLYKKAITVCWYVNLFNTVNLTRRSLSCDKNKRSRYSYPMAWDSVLLHLFTYKVIILLKLWQTGLFGCVIYLWTDVCLMGFEWRYKDFILFVYKKVTLIVSKFAQYYHHSDLPAHYLSVILTWKYLFLSSRHK